MSRASKFRGEGRFSALPYSMTGSLAWYSLKSSAVKVYIELLRRYNGLNNGMLILSYGAAAKLLGMSKSTVKAAFDELRDKGFIVCTRQGSWFERLAATWRLTHRADDSPNGGLSTNDWRIWSNEQTKKGDAESYLSVLAPNHKGTVAEPEGYSGKTRGNGLGTAEVPKNVRNGGAMGTDAERL